MIWPGESRKRRSAALAQRRLYGSDKPPARRAETLFWSDQHLTAQTRPCTAFCCSGICGDRWVKRTRWGRDKKGSGHGRRGQRGREETASHHGDVASTNCSWRETLSGGISVLGVRRDLRGRRQDRV